METKQKQPIPEVDQLKLIFIKAKQSLLSETEALKNRLTQTFWEFLKWKIDHGQLINIAIRGEVRTGKSTVGIKIAWEANKYLLKKGLITENVHDIMFNSMFSDQTEFLRFINSEERNRMILIDEFNTMAKTGLNATTEEALFDYYSSVFAVQYIHRISASTYTIQDRNANVILDVIGADEPNKSTRCKLTYRDIATGQQAVIGIVDIYVGDITQLWDKEVKQIIEIDGVKTIEEQKRIDKWKETDFYVRYQVKKHKRLRLLKNEGVRDIRELEFADIILGVLRELEDYAKIQKVDQDLINITADEVRRKTKRIYSILTLSEIGQKSRALLNLYHTIHKMNKKMNSKTITPQEAMIMDKIIKQSQALLKKRVDEQMKLSQLYKEYIKIE